jgi:membrane protein implicated in regulation of membrane protease activity
MVEGLIGVLIFSFITLIVGIVIKSWWVMIPQIIIIAVVVFLLVRVRVKVSKAEKEKLRAKIDELEGKIESLAQKPE